MTIVSGHQPAYLPWLGLLHKASLCDVFVYMDDVQFLDRDFNHRNRVITPTGQVLWLTVPIDKKNSRSRVLKDIRIAKGNDKTDWRQKHVMTLRSCYGKTTYFKEYWPFFQWLYHDRDWELLTELNLAILKQIFQWFRLAPRIIVGSQSGFTCKKSDLVLEHATKNGAQAIVTGAMGKNYIQQKDFDDRGIKLFFQEYKHPHYEQGKHGFTPQLAFVDLLFRYGPDSPEIAFNGNISKDEIL